jgi:hypothetical protein
LAAGRISNFKLIVASCPLASPGLSPVIFAAGTGAYRTDLPVSQAGVLNRSGLRGGLHFIIASLAAGSGAVMSG